MIGFGVAVRVGALECLFHRWLRWFKLRIRFGIISNSKLCDLRLDESFIRQGVPEFT